MMNYFKINYGDLNDNYYKFLEFAFKGSDYFSIITNLKRPYSKIPPNCNHDETLKILSPYLKKQIIGIRHWSNNGTNDNHTVMNVYFSNKHTLKLISFLGNFLFPEEANVSEDICFYKEDKIWIATVSHEKMAFLYSNSGMEIRFLEQNGIKYYYENPMEIYNLPE